MRGLHVDVYRADLRDCTNGGVTSPGAAAGKSFILFDEAFPSGNYSLDECKDREDTVCLRIVRRRLGRSGEYLHVEPMFPAAPGHVMWGGNFVYSCDSRFRDIAEYPLPVHDRVDNGR